ncbi:MAG: hypothetical protein WC543_00955 [Candidatus Omnitrophota bacterium]
MKNKAQATLEFTVVFIIMVALLIGMVKLWKMSSDRIISRQVEYNASRLKAGEKDATLVAPLKVIKKGSGSGSYAGKAGGYGGGSSGYSGGGYGPVGGGGW